MSLYYQDGMATIYEGDCLSVLRNLPAESVHCCVTSPPYWGLRDYGVEGQIGLEPSPAEYVGKLVEIFREVRRVLRSDGTCWMNLGDSYTSGGRTTRDPGQSKIHPAFTGEDNAVTTWRPKDPPGLKPKDLVGIPWRVAFALQEDGWWLRQDIIWAKPNPMPESVTDRCTKSHEYIFLLSKSPKYYYDAEAVKEESSPESQARYRYLYRGNKMQADRSMMGYSEGDKSHIKDRNRRSVWTVSTKPYSGAHFACFPPDLIEPCILAGCPEGGTVLDPFLGSGTTVMVANECKRNGIGIELNPNYLELVRERITGLQVKLLA